MFHQTFTKFILIAVLISTLSCQKNNTQTPTVVASSMRDVPALRLNYRFESDVPAPEKANETVQVEGKNGLVQGDFDQNRPQEILDMTLTSPDKQKVLAIYHNVADFPSEFRLDMYGADGKLIKTITHDGMAVHFPDTIVWSPDSTSVAFVAMARLGKLNGLINDSEDSKSGEATPVPTIEAIPEANSNANTELANSNIEPDAAATPATDGTTPVLTFRTEQIYLCDANGNDLKPLTQNEGLIYFYFVWSPDSSALAALASKFTEWRIFQYQAEQKGETFKPFGRPRIVEKTGRQRLLDDYPTQVHPVWSPDSAKVAAAFDKRVRIYDAIGNGPTQAEIVLRNQLLLSSKTYDDTKRVEMGSNFDAEVNSETNANANKAVNNNANANNAANLPAGVLPDESTLVSFNPIVRLFWTEDTMLYFETAYVREFKESTNNVRSNVRWHRLILSPQAVALGN
jgi:Tol biopolymer transport system component